MARPLKERFFGRFLGVRNRGNVLSMADSFAVEGSKNFYHPNEDEVTGIPGYTPLSATWTLPIRALTSFRYEVAGAAVRKLVAVVGDELYEIDTDTGAKTLVGGGLGASGPVGFATANDTLYIASGGTAQVKKWDGTTYGNVAETQPPQPTAAAGATGLPDGTYFFRAILVDSAGARGPASPKSDAISVTKQLIDVTLAAPGAGNTWEIYSTRGDNPDFSYKVGTSAGTTFTLNMSDDNIVLGEPLQHHGDPPPLGPTVALWSQNMLLLAGIEGQGSRIFLSDIRKSDSYAATRVVDINPQDGDKIRHMSEGITAAEKGDLQPMTAIVFKEWGIWNVWGLEPAKAGAQAPFIVERSTSNVGTVASETVLELRIGSDDRVVFLAPDRTIRAYDGRNAEDISEPVRGYLRRMNLSAATLSWGQKFPGLQLAVWQFPIDGSTVPNFALALDLEKGIWIPIPDWPSFAAGALHFDANDNELYYVGEAVAVSAPGIYRVARNFFGDSFDGDPIEWVWRSRPLLGEDRLTKTHEAIQPFAATGTGGNVTVKIWPGYMDPDTEVPLMETSFTTVKAGHTHVEPVIQIESSSGEFLVDPRATYQFSQSSTGPKDTILGFGIAYRDHERKRFRA